MGSAKTILKWLVVLLIVKVTVQITSNYVGYFPADFQTDFLSGRKPQFNIPYAIAFYAHIIASPTTIVSGLLLLNNSFRLRYPTFHRFMGRFHVFAILLLVCPSGLWMSAYAFSGAIAGFGFVALSLITALCATMGWRYALLRKFHLHRTWMARCFVLLCSAIILRLMAGIASFIAIDTEVAYRASSWLCWLIPLGIFELYSMQRNTRHVSEM